MLLTCVPVIFVPALTLDRRLQGGYNLFFVLTAAGALHHAGAERWIDSLDTRVLEGLQFALSLDSVGDWDEGGLVMRIAREPKGASLQALFAEFGRVAASLDIRLEVQIDEVRACREGGVVSCCRFFELVVAPTASA